jgi:glycosyltransferase involved in cell wall biosynthesis
MRPLRIALFHGPRDRSFMVRCQQPLSWLQRQGAIEILPVLKAWEADVAFFHNYWEPEAMGILRSLQWNGIRVVANVDRDLFDAPDRESPPRARQVCEAVDAVFVPNRPLASCFSRVNAKVEVNPSGIDLALWRGLKAKPRDSVRTVGFAAAATHSANLEILRPVLAKLSNKFKQEGIRFVCFGFQPSWLSGVLPGPELVESCGPEDYPARLMKLGIDLALAPLAINPFNKSRSVLKLYEYAAAGAVTIATSAEPYASAIQDGTTGLLVDNKPESWIQAISKLIRTPDLRRQLLDAARQALERHDLSVTAPRMLEALEATKPNRQRTFFALPRTHAERNLNVDVVIPVYNAPAFTRQAIEATLPDLDANHRLILVDDASPDPEIATLLSEYDGRPWITVHRSPKNQGFVGSCNLAALELARPDADIILLNSDARPMPGFIRRLSETAGSNPAIGTVTAVSNNGSIASVLDVCDAQTLSAELENPLVIVPTAVGHLMYIKREVIQKYGLFDLAFAPGYGEENDLSLRISDQYVNVIDTGCWCWHAGSASFQGSMSQLRIDHDALINKRYPHYQFEVQAYWSVDPLRQHRRRMLAATRDPRPRVLHVVHSYEGGGGTEKHVRDLEGALSDRFLGFAAAPHDDLKLYSATIPMDARPYVKANWPLTPSVVAENDKVWAGVLREWQPSLIHFHHLLHHPLSLLPKLIGTGIPVIVSLHDYYFLCPDYTLQHCPGVNSCETCFPERFKGPAEYQRLRRDLLGSSLRQAAAIVAPSRAAAKLVREVYPNLDIRVIPHGIRALPRIVRGPSSKIRFGMMGNVTPVKGIEVMLKAWPLVAHKGEAELHVYGAASDPRYIQRCAELGIHYHGPYSEGDLPRILSQIDIGILPSQQPETFCYALTEYFAGDVPVVGSDYGNLGDQIIHGVNGLKVPRDDPRAWADAISMLIQDPALRERIAQGVRPPDSIRNMAAKYAALYRVVIEEARSAPPSLPLLGEASLALAFRA